MSGQEAGKREALINKIAAECLIEARGDVQSALQLVRQHADIELWDDIEKAVGAVIASGIAAGGNFVQVTAKNLSLAEMRKLLRKVEAVRKDFPACAEGVCSFHGVEFFFTFAFEPPVLTVNCAPRSESEAVLNEHGLSTIEPWAPVWSPK